MPIPLFQVNAVALVLIVRGGRCLNVVLPRDAGERVEALVREEQANAG